MESYQTHKQKGFTIIELMIAMSIFAMILLLASIVLTQIGKAYYKGVTSSQTQDTARSILNEISRAVQFSGAPIQTRKCTTYFGTVCTPPDTTTSPSTGAYTTDRGWYFCVGNERYSYVLGKELTNTLPTPPGNFSTKVLLRDATTNGVCNDPAVDDPTSHPYVELLAPKMRLALLSICSPGEADPNIDCPVGKQPLPNSQLYKVRILVVFGDDDVLGDYSDSEGSRYSSPPTVPLDNILDGCQPVTGAQFCSVSLLTSSIERRI